MKWKNIGMVLKVEERKNKMINWSRFKKKSPKPVTKDWRLHSLKMKFPKSLKELKYGIDSIIITDKELTVLAKLKIHRDICGYNDKGLQIPYINQIPILIEGRAHYYGFTNEDHEIIFVCEVSDISRFLICPGNIINTGSFMCELDDLMAFKLAWC